MKKRILAAFLAIMFFSTSALLSFAENDTPAEETDNSLWEQIPISSEEQVTTGNQEKAQEESVDVDADIQDDIEAVIPQYVEEIKIGSAEEFMEFVNNCKLDTWSANKKVILTKDISVVGRDFKGIPSFGGYFDGQGHTISDVNITSGLSYVGFFKHIQKNGIVTNLNVNGSIMPTGNTTIVGGLCGQNYGVIYECGFKGVVAGNDYIGGITGINELSGDIRFCTSEGFMSGTHFIGGVTGKNDGNIANCKNEALVNITNTDTEVTIDSMEKLNAVLNLFKNGIDKKADEASADVTVSDVGGIAGISIGIISRCINNGNVGYDHVGYNIGGIAGRQSGYLVNCSNNGVIKGRKDVGGIVGQAEPYITVDFATDIAYQLSEAVAQLHDTVSATLKETKNQSNVVSARLAVIQKFTGQAVEDTRFIANGTVDFANGLSSSTNEAFSRVEYVMDEASKQGGVMDSLTDAAGSTKKTASDMKNAVGDLDIEKYIKSDDERKQYEDAKTILNSAAAQYEDNYAKSYPAYFNYKVYDHKTKYEGTQDIGYYVDEGSEPIDDGWSIFDVRDDIAAGTGTASKGSWKHAADMSSFPNDSSDDNSLVQEAASFAQEEADEYARDMYINPITGEGGSATYKDDLAAQAIVISSIYGNHVGEMTDAARTDTQSAMNNLGAASDSLAKAGSQTKGIIGNIAGREDIRFPQFSDEYKLHTSSLADNLASMNDNFGLLNSEINNATGVLADHLMAVNDQFNNILNLYTDALDGVLEKDYTNMFNDDSLSNAETTTDATVDGCFNFGICQGDIDVSGIAGTMAIEYDFDKESDVTGLKDSGINGSYLTKCVLRDNRNYGEITSQKSYAGGICGLQEMGTIINCGSYASIKSTAGSYVGGVSGQSLSYIMKCYAKGELEGTSYVGGVAGDGKHLRECLTIVSIDDDPDWSGAIAGHVAEGGEVRENYFVSDTLAGLDKVSYSKKAEPVSYDAVISNQVFKEIEEETTKKEEEKKSEAKVVSLKTGSDEIEDAISDYRNLPYEFNNITVNFVLEDENLDDGKERVARINKSYGDRLDSSDYPGVKDKEGYYVDWDIKEVDKLVCDVTVTANYKRYRTTLAEPGEAENMHQSELLVDGRFKEEDKLEVEKTVYLTDENVSAHLDNYETLKVKIPDDGQKTHQIRFRAINNYADLVNEFGGLLGAKPTLYQVVEGKRFPLEKTGTIGEYSLYNIDGNEFMLSLSIEGAKSAAVTIMIIIGIVFILLIVLFIVVVNIIKRHGGNVPKIFNGFIIKMSERIENKEQLFYDESKESENNKVSEDYSEYHDPDEKADTTEEIDTADVPDARDNDFSDNADDEDKN